MWATQGSQAPGRAWGEGGQTSLRPEESRAPLGTPGIYAGGHRQVIVDILRGYFIVSMASGHLSTGAVSKLLHVWHWVDGAAGFVCLSGFVLALSQRSKWQRGLGRVGQIWILQRAGLIWLISMALTLTALSLRLSALNLPFIEDIFTRERIAAALVDVARLELRVPYLGLLAMYVAFLLAAFPAVLALKRNLDVLVIGVSAAIYVAAQVDALNHTASSTSPLVEGRFVVMAWQFLFFAGLCVGWRWKEIFQPLAQRWQWPLFWLSLPGVGALLLLAHGHKLPVLRAIHPGDVFSGYFAKYTLSPFVLLYFGLLLGVLPTAIAMLRRAPYVAPVLDVVALFGRHSLGCYVILCGVQIVSWIVVAPATPHAAKHFGWLFLALVLFAVFCWAAERRRHGPDKTPPLGAEAPLPR